MGRKWTTPYQRSEAYRLAHYWAARAYQRKQVMTYRCQRCSRPAIVKLLIDQTGKILLKKVLTLCWKHRPSYSA